MGQIRIHINLSQLVGLFFNLLLIFELVRLHLVVELGDKGAQASNGKESRIGRVVNANCGGWYASLIIYVSMLMAHSFPFIK